MDKRRKVGFIAKLLSNHYYLSEVPVEGKTNVKLFHRFGYNEHYVAQIIRTGNCITLLSSHFTVTEDTFWNTNYFEDLTRYVFWTFNKSFLLKLTEKMESLKPSNIKRCAELLKENFTPYGEPLPYNADEELQWCYVKNGNLKKDSRFSQMYLVDQQNRTVILNAVEKRIADSPKPLPQPVTITETSVSKDETGTTVKIILFLDVLRPMNGSPEETLQFIMQKTKEAGFEDNLFTPVRKLDNGKNKYGLNGCIAAMIDYFYQLDYFKEEYNIEEIFKAYLHYSGNKIGKLKTFISDYWKDKSFEINTAKLKQLKVKKLP